MEEQHDQQNEEGTADVADAVGRSKDTLEDTRSSTSFREDKRGKTLLPKEGSCKMIEKFLDSLTEKEKIERRMTLLPLNRSLVSLAAPGSAPRDKHSEAGNTEDVLARKSFGGEGALLVFERLRVARSDPNISWREQLEKLKEELALPEKVSKMYPNVEKASDNGESNESSSSSVAQVEPPIGVVDQLSSQAILKDIDLDFLSTFGSGEINRDLARQSVFIHFDPLVAKALENPIPSKEKERRASPSELTVEESVQRISVVKEQITESRKRDLRELDALIEKLMKEIEELENKSKTPEMLSTSEQTEMLMKLDAEIPRLSAELNSGVPEDVQQLVGQLDVCDEQMKELAGELEKFEASKEKIIEEAKQDSNSYKEHLEYMEEIFDTVYQNYLKAKISRKGIIHNNAVLETSNQELTETDNKFRENLVKIKEDHERSIMNAKKELACKETEIRELNRKLALNGVPVPTKTLHQINHK